MCPCVNVSVCSCMAHAISLAALTSCLVCLPPPAASCLSTAQARYSTCCTYSTVLELERENPHVHVASLAPKHREAWLTWNRIISLHGSRMMQHLIKSCYPTNPSHPISVSLEILPHCLLFFLFFPTMSFLSSL